MDKNIVKIELGINGSGFFLKFPNNKKKEKFYYVLATNNHIIKIEDIKEENKTINIKFSDEQKKTLKLKFTNDRKRYSNEKLDITLIEIKKSDGLEDENYLELDDLEDFDTYILDSKEDNFRSNLENSYATKTIYNISIPENDVLVSYGNADKMYKDDSYSFPHSCETQKGSSGSPIFLLNTNKVIGIHRGFLNTKKNIGVIIFPAIKDYISNTNNLITIEDPNKDKKTAPKKNEEQKEDKEEKI